MYDEDGARAFVDGVGFDANPYADGSEAGVSWAAGWMLAERGEFRWNHKDIGKMPIAARPVVDAEPHNFPANFSERLADWGDPVAEEALTPEDLIQSMRNDPAEAEMVVQKLTKAKRKKFTELLNVELAELQQERGGPREDLPREAEIEKLLGLFARVGEM